jgi:hypothetical protein
MTSPAMGDGTAIFVYHSVQHKILGTDKRGFRLRRRGTSCVVLLRPMIRGLATTLGLGS